MDRGGRAQSRRHVHEPGARPLRPARAGRHEAWALERTGGGAHDSSVAAMVAHENGPGRLGGARDCGGRGDPAGHAAPRAREAGAARTRGAAPRQPDRSAHRAPQPALPGLVAPAGDAEVDARIAHARRGVDRKPASAADRRRSLQVDQRPLLAWRRRSRARVGGGSVDGTHSRVGPRRAMGRRRVPGRHAERPARACRRFRGTPARGRRGARCDARPRKAVPP